MKTNKFLLIYSSIYGPSRRLFGLTFDTKKFRPPIRFYVWTILMIACFLNQLVLFFINDERILIEYGDISYQIAGINRVSFFPVVIFFYLSAVLFLLNWSRQDFSNIVQMELLANKLQIHRINHRIRSTTKNIKILKKEKIF